MIQFKEHCHGSEWMRLGGRYNYLRERRSRNWKSSVLIIYHPCEIEITKIYDRSSIRNSERHLRVKFLKDYGAWRRESYSPCSKLPLPSPTSFIIILPLPVLNPILSDCHIHSSVDSRSSSMRETKQALCEKLSGKEVSRFQLHSKAGKERKHWERGRGYWRFCW